MLALVWPASSDARESRCSNKSTLAVRACIWQAAKQYQQNYYHAKACASAESGLNPYAYFGNGGNRSPKTALVYSGDISAGTFQFKPSTFEGTPYHRRSIWSAKWNSKAAMWMWSRGRIGEWAAPAC